MVGRKNTPSTKSLMMYEDVELNGMTYREAAVKYEVVETTVRANVKSVREYRLQVFQEETEDPSLTATSDLFRLEMQYNEAMQAWHQSRLEANRRGLKGDVRYLQLAQRLLADIRKLRGETRRQIILQAEEQADEYDLTIEQRREAILSIVGYPRRARANRRGAKAADGGKADEME